ncbi:hypothetical protein ABK905_14220 [Acerihabitans sp. KWT182]|uniref:Class I SAM-dependent methyltransferase n=1 Tax=Acerihabitans sp. KWT182 TaxID=3157919 RepID=A0AAU7Q4W4_9GAMM
MIPSAIKNNDPTAFNPRHNVEVPPLTVRDVIKITRLAHGKMLNHRHFGNFSWVENEHSSLNGRIDYLNKATMHIIESLSSRENPVTLVSLGSGGLLTEWFLHQQLKRAGFQKLNWRLIDVDYQKGGYEECLKDFKKKLEKEDVRAFITEQDYFNETIGHDNLKNNDKAQGAVVVLNIAPPRALKSSSALAAANDPDCMLVRGRPIQEVEKANGIYLFKASQTYKQDLLNVKQLLSDGDSIVHLDCALNCAVNNVGDVVVRHSPSQTGRALNEGIKPYLDKLEGIGKSLGRKIELHNLDKSLERFVADIIHSGEFGLKFLVSDYDTSLAKLREHFLDGNNPVLFATFDNNESSFM